MSIKSPFPRLISRSLLLTLSFLIAAFVAFAAPQEIRTASAQGTLTVDLEWGEGDLTCPGNTQHFDIIVSNTTGVSQTVVVTLELPERTYFIPGNSRTTPTDYTYNEATRTLTFAPRVIANGTTFTYGVLVSTNTTNRAGDVAVFRATATGGGFSDDDVETTVYAACPTAVELGSLNAVGGSTSAAAALVGLGVVALGGLVVVRRRTSR